MVRLLLAVTLSAVVLMAWGFVFWMTLPFGAEMVKKAEHEDELSQALNRSISESGTYFVPYADCSAGPVEDTVAERFIERYKQGPLVRIIYRKEGADPTSPMVFVTGFGHTLVSSLLAATLLTLALPGLSSYLSRVVFVSLLGIFASVAMNLSDPIWFQSPWKFELMMSGFQSVGWVFSALVMGLIIRPRS